MFFALPFLIKFVRSQIAKINDQTFELDKQTNASQNSLDSPEIQKQKAVQVAKQHKISVKDLERLKTAASKLAHELGTKYNWYDPKSWTENDVEVGKILKYEGRNLNIIADLYYHVYTTSKNLKTDLIKNLDKDVLDDVRLSWKINKITPFI